MNKETVLYRLGAGLSSKHRNRHFFHQGVEDSFRIFWIKELRRYLLELGEHKVIRKKERKLMLTEIAITVFNNKKNFFSYHMLKIIRGFLGIVVR